MITLTQLNEPTPFRLLFSLNFNVMVDEFAITSAIKRCIARSNFSGQDRPVVYRGCGNPGHRKN